MGEIVWEYLRFNIFFVNVPDEHKVIVPEVVSRIILSPLMPKINIRSSREEPSVPYKVQHRGYWFYIDDMKIASRKFLEGMVAAYSSRVGSKQLNEEGQLRVVIPSLWQRLQLCSRSYKRVNPSWVVRANCA